MNKKGKLVVNPNYAKNLNRKIIYVLVGLAILSFLIFYMTTLSPKRCYNYECFESKLKSCSKAVYLNEQNEASWEYTIKKNEGRNCLVKVEILQAKEGELGIHKLEGNSMICKYGPSSTGYPEEDLANCSGQLKENLQEIIIQKLHKYVVENLGKLDESLKGV